MSQRPACDVLSAGQKCWRARRGYGAFLTFDLGAEVDGGRFGEWHLWAYIGAWRIAEAGVVLATWGDSSDEQIEQAVGLATGRRLLSAQVIDAEGTTEFAFESDLFVTVGPPLIPNEGAETDGEWWLLYTPDGTVLFPTAGPIWHLEPSAATGIGP